ncbi:hypothetical protein C1646_755245 [Rhizophagus diaphanus]|nr:hypothetical protein C1646_755245 [Rhizophagus diaphanus] [Rhizophagus sp. MUCL 43196]
MANSTTTKGNSVKKRVYYKDYSNLRFDVVRSPQQTIRWNRLTSSILGQERHLCNIKSYILHPSSSNVYNPTVFKQIHHLPEKCLLTDKHPLGQHDPRHNRDSKKDKRREKNWSRRQKKRNKRKKPLPPLSPGTLVFFIATPTVLTYSTAKSDVVSTLANYLTTNTDITTPLELDNVREILNAPDVFFRRTPPPDNISHTTISDTY